jgi:hypothetical protein
MTWDLGIITTIAVAIIYAFVLGGREERIREYLRTRAHGWLRRRYVRAMVRAVQGYAAVTDSTMLLAIALGLFASLNVFILSSVSQLESQQRGLEAHSREVGKKLANERSQLDSLDRPRDFEAERGKSRKQLDELISALRDVNADIEGERPGLLRVVLFGKATASVGLILLFIATVFWGPLVLIRARFAHEIARFSLRIQGLATKDELAKLTEAELGVRNQDTLRRYVEVMKDVAARHGVPELTRTFELWQD